MKHREFGKKAALLFDRTFAIVALFAVACGNYPPVQTAQVSLSRVSKAKEPKRTQRIETLRVVASRSSRGELLVHSYDAEQLFNIANDLVDKNRCTEAINYFNQVFLEFRESQYTPSALFNAGLCLKKLASNGKVGERIEPLAKDTRNTNTLEQASRYFALSLEQLGVKKNLQLQSAATSNLLGLLIELEHWNVAELVSNRTLAKKNNSSEEQLEAMARRAQALLGKRNFEATKAQANQALNLYRDKPDTEPTRRKYFAAAANYVLAEIVRSQVTTLSFPETSLEEQQQILASRARLLLDAQAEYYQTILLLDNHWIAASGYQIGAMYDELWHAVMNAPIPKHLHPEGHATYRQELAKMLKPLIRHAIRFWELTTLVIQNNGLQITWTQKLEKDLERMKALLQIQPEGPGKIVIPPKTQSPTEQNISSKQNNLP